MSILSQLKAVACGAAELDIFDITYEHTNEELGILSFGSEAHPRKGLLTRLASYLYWMSRHAGRALLARGPGIVPGSVVFFANSKNEFDSLNPVCRRLEHGQFIGTWGDARNNLNLFACYMVGLLFLPRVLRLMRTSQGYRRASFYYVLDHYLAAYGCYCLGRLWFRATRPSLFIVANHLAALNRALLEAAKAESVPSLYLLHATISEVYPPLNVDYALLEGMDTLQKYNALGSTDAKVFLVGMAKHDRYRDRINLSQWVRTLGICINGLDPSSRVEELCESIAVSFPDIRVILRPHPADRRSAKWIELANRLGFGYSDWRVEPAFEFLARVDVNIAGDSGIHVEAALLNVMPLYYDFDDKRLDLYGFRRRGLVDFAADATTFARWFRDLLSRDKPHCRQRAKIYCATVGTQWDWRSAELSQSAIERIRCNGGIDTRGWRRIEGIALEAYEPSADDSASIV